MVPYWRRLAAAGLVTFVVGLVVMFPARVAWHWFAPPGVALAGIEGSVWRGSAQEASAHGVYLRDVQWRWLPQQLLGARLAYHVEGKPGGGFLDGEFGAGMGGSLSIDNLRAAIPLPLFEQAVGVPGLQGTANADIRTLRMKAGVPQVVDGTLDVSGLVLPTVAPSPLGRFRAEFQTQEGTILASVQDDGAVLDLAGRLQLGADREYDFLGNVAATAETPESVVRQLQFLGSPDAQGRHELRLSGRY